MGLPRLVPASDHSILVLFGEEICAETHDKIRRLMARFSAGHPFLNLHPAYSTLLLRFDPRTTDPRRVEDTIRSALEDLESVALPPPRTVEIPVRYGGEFGPDLEDVARSNGIDTAEVIRIHSSADYVVNFLGFAPGFPYLSGLPASIATPRLSTPRKRVPAGSVAIGGNHTGIYPVASPGGWRIIGHTPIELFRTGREPLSLLEMGDHVRFIPIR
jgi:KipI family sensor histidine kinase inhibitor